MLQCCLGAATDVAVFEWGRKWSLLLPEVWKGELLSGGGQPVCLLSFKVSSAPKPPVRGWVHTCGMAWTDTSKLAASLLSLEIITPV